MTVREALVVEANIIIDTIESKPRQVLTKWEEDFLDSVKAQIAEKQFISVRQLEILKKIDKGED